jgi:hypothetical protein
MSSCAPVWAHIPSALTLQSATGLLLSCWTLDYCTSFEWLEIACSFENIHPFSLSIPQCWARNWLYLSPCAHKYIASNWVVLCSVLTAWAIWSSYYFTNSISFIFWMKFHLLRSYRQPVAGPEFEPRLSVSESHTMEPLFSWYASIQAFLFHSLLSFGCTVGCVSTVIFRSLIIPDPICIR